MTDEAESDETADTNPLTSLVDDGELNENALKDKAKKVRRTLRSTNHFSRQDRPLKRAEGFVMDSLERLRNLSAFNTAHEDGDWSELANAPEGVAQSIDPFLSFYRSHGKLPDIALDEALAYVLYVGVVKGEIFFGSDLQLSSDTPRGSYS